MATIRRVLPKRCIMLSYKWLNRFLYLAKEVSTWSKDPSTGVGAVIARPDKTVASLGFNGLPRSIEDSLWRLNDRSLKYPLTIHAEENAILNARESLNGYTICIYPLPPCFDKCAPKIIQAGLSRVAFPQIPEDAEGRWIESAEKSFVILEEAGVMVTEVLMRREDQ